MFISLIIKQLFFIVYSKNAKRKRINLKNFIFNFYKKLKILILEFNYIFINFYMNKSFFIFMKKIISMNIRFFFHYIFTFLFSYLYKKKKNFYFF